MDEKDFKSMDHMFYAKDTFAIKKNIELNSIGKESSCSQVFCRKAVLKLPRKFFGKSTVESFLSKVAGFLPKRGSTVDVILKMFLNFSQ